MADPSLFSDGQVAALCSCIVSAGAGVGALLRWCAKRIELALDESTKERKDHGEKFVELRAKVDEVHDYVQELERERTPRFRRPRTPRND